MGQCASLELTSIKEAYRPMYPVKTDVVIAVPIKNCHTLS